MKHLPAHLVWLVGLAGVCLVVAGACETDADADAMLCDPVDCDDGKECTADACNPAGGECSHPPLADGTSCDFGAGRCAGDTCESSPDEEACSAALPVAADGVDLDVDVYAVFDTGPGGLSFDANGNLFAGNLTRNWGMYFKIMWLDIPPRYLYPFVGCS